MRWHRKLVTRRWDYSNCRGSIVYHICDTIVGHILKQQGIATAPDRKRHTSWATFLKAHWDVLAAIEFTTVEVWRKDRLVTGVAKCS